MKGNQQYGRTLLAIEGRQQEHAGVAIANEHSALEVDVCCIESVHLAKRAGCTKGEATQQVQCGVQSETTADGRGVGKTGKGW